MEKGPFTQTGTEWFQFPLFAMTLLLDRDFLEEDLASALHLLPAVRLYCAVLLETHEKKTLTVVIQNEYLRRRTSLDKFEFSRAYARLARSGLLRSKKAGKKARQYEVLGQQGESAKSSNMLAMKNDQYGLY